MSEPIPRGGELICSDIIPTGTWVMLSEKASPELVFQIGSEAVMRIWFQFAGDIYPNGDGDLVLKRSYSVIHQHRGRLFVDIPEDMLTVVTPESGIGQKLLHDELTRDFLARLL